MPQEKPVDSTAEEIPSHEERMRSRRFDERPKRQYTEEELRRLAQLDVRMQQIVSLGNAIAMGAVAFALFGVSKRLDGIDALMSGLRQNGVQISVTTARHLAENAEDIAGLPVG